MKWGDLTMAGEILLIVTSAVGRNSWRRLQRSQHVPHCRSLSCYAIFRENFRPLAIHLPCGFHSSCQLYKFNYKWDVKKCSGHIFLVWCFHAACKSPAPARTANRRPCDSCDTPDALEVMLFRKAAKPRGWQCDGFGYIYSSTSSTGYTQGSYPWMNSISGDIHDSLCNMTW